MDKSNKKNKKNKKYKKKNKISKKLDEGIPYILTKYSTEFDILNKEFRENKINTIVFEELSTQILLKIDSIETNGVDQIRTYRKELVKYINTILGEN